MKVTTSDEWRSHVVTAIVSAALSSISTLYYAEFLKGTGLVGGIFLRSAAVCILLFPLLVTKGFAGQWARIRSNWRGMCAIVVLRGCIAAYLLAVGYALTDPLKATFLTKIEPYLVLMWGFVLLKERISKQEFFLLAIHLIGAVLLSVGAHGLHLGAAQQGDLLLIAGMAVTALSYIYTKKLFASHDAPNPITINLVTNIFIAAVYLPLFLCCSQEIPLETWPHVAGYLFIIVFLFDICSLSLWYRSLKVLPGWLVSALRALGPLFAVPVAYLFLNRYLDVVQWIGAAIVLGTSILLSRRKAHSKING